MTEPLIDRNKLIDAIADAPVDTLLADAVLDYLRSVLTPEALDPQEEWHGPKRELSRGWSDGHDLHRRIFGDVIQTGISDMPKEHDTETDMPLIDRDVLAQTLYMNRALTTETLVDCEAITNIVVACLRRMLTPDVLDPLDLDLGSPGTDLHRRIFGEDR